MAKSLIEQLPKVAKEGWRVVASMIDSLDAKITGVAWRIIPNYALISSANTTNTPQKYSKIPSASIAFKAETTQKSDSSQSRTESSSHPIQTISKKRVADHGEVYTHPREVNAMLDLVKHECENIESTFLEPACGTGNFLIEILRRKLDAVQKRYKKQDDFEIYALIAAASLYGIELLSDNVRACRARLFAEFDAQYTAKFRKKASNTYRQVIAHLLELNIVHGDALTMRTADAPTHPIVFSEFKRLDTGYRLVRIDFEFAELVEHQSTAPTAPTTLSDDLFANTDKTTAKKSTLKENGEPYITPRELFRYPPTHYLKLFELKTANNQEVRHD